MLQRQDALRTKHSKLPVPERFKIIAIALGALAVLTLLFIVSNKAEMPGDLGYPTSLYGP